MAQPSFSTLSLEYVPVQWTATKSGAVYNPTSDTAYMAFVAGSVTATPASLTWYSASWDTANNAYYALCLIGPSPGLVALTAGVWTVFAKVTDNPEAPVKNAGTILMY